MTTGRRWTDGEVSAFVDGVLEPEAATQLAVQVQQDLALAERVARQRASRRKPAVAGVVASDAPAAHDADEPAGDALPPSLAADPGLPPPAATAPHGAPSALWWGGTAVVAALAVLLGWKLPRTLTDPVVPHPDGLAAGGALAEALDRRISAEGNTDAGVLVSLSFRASDGRYCRIFSLSSGIDGLACRSRDAWMVEATGRTRTDPLPPDAPRQPPSELSAAVLAAMMRWQAGHALTPEQERHARESSWR